MSIAVRTASTSWSGNLASGNGTVTGKSGALDALPVTWAARTEEPGGKTSPEELAAAAHSSCYSMALAATLAGHKITPNELNVSSVVTLDEVDGKPTIVSSDLTVNATIPTIDEATFNDIIEEASALCPISRLFTGAKITVDATLAG